MNFDAAISHNVSPQYPYLVMYIQTKFLGVFSASAVHVQITSASFWPVTLKNLKLRANGCLS